MSKPDDIPQDVWGAAEIAVDNTGFPSGDMPTGVMEHDIRVIVARAILAERERCAVRVEQHRDWLGGYRFPQEVRRLIAAKIRKGD